MKAREGEEIVCKCSRPAGTFLSDIDQGSSISSRTLKFPCPALQMISVAGSLRSAERKWLSVTLPISGARRQNAVGCPKETCCHRDRRSARRPARPAVFSPTSCGLREAFGFHFRRQIRVRHRRPA